MSSEDKNWFLAEILAAIKSPDMVDPDLIAEVSVAYADACHTTNSRLEEAERLLGLGLRNEAVEFAERQPPLLDEIGRLDLTRLDEWQELLMLKGMQQPPELNLEGATALNEAYAELQDLAPLLGKHRVLAAARAPLSARLSILRQLRDRDPLNPAWGEDLETYEQRRAKEVEGELRTAIRNQDAPAIRELANEVGQTDWHIDFPKDVSGQLRQAMGAVDTTEARAELQALIDPIEAAYNEMDADGIARLAAQWRQAEPIAQLNANDPTIERIGPALDWHDEQVRLQAEAARFQAAVDQLEQTLDAEADAASVSRAYDAARRHDTPLPTVLEQRARQRLASLEQLRRRRLSLGIGAVILGVLVVSSFAGLFVWRSIQQREREGHAAALTQLIAEESLDSAQSYVDQLDTATRESPELSQLVYRLDDLNAAEQRRVGEFTDLIGRAEAMDLAAPEPGLVDRVSNLAITADEKRRARDIQSAVGAKQNEMRRAQDARMATVLTEWTDRLAEIDQRLNDGGSLEVTEERSLVSEVDSALSPFRGATASLRRSGEALVQKARTLVNFSRKQRALSDDLAGIFGAVGDVAGYREQLSSFARKHPEAPEANAAKEIAASKTWESVIRWNSFWDTKGRDLSKLTPAKAKRLLAEGALLMPVESPPRHALEFDFQRRKAHLEKIAARPEAAAKLRSWMKEPLFESVWAIRKSDREIVYSLDEPNTSNANAVSYSDFDESLAKTMRSTRDPLWHGLAPHSSLSRKALTAASAVEGSAWERAFAGLVLGNMRALANPPKGDAAAIDALVGVDLLRRLLVIGAEGSEPFEAATRPFLDPIKSAPIDFLAPWYLDDNPRGRDARNAARTVVPDPNRFILQIREAQPAFEFQASGPEPVRWVGVIDRTQPSKPRLRIGSQPLSDGLLVVVVEGRKEFLTVGRVVNGQPRLESQSATVTGTPVFLTTAPTVEGS